MDRTSRIYVAGHQGLVGSAIMRRLAANGCKNIVFRKSKDLDLRRQTETERFFEEERPEYVFLAAARVGGILANSAYRAEFIYDNIVIAANIIHSSYKWGVKKLLNLGSSCIYPKSAPQPLKEEYLLTGSLESTNEPYAIAKISAIKLCRYYNEQYGTNFISVMPTNLYGPNDNFDLENSHVLPALIRKMHLGKCLGKGDFEAIRKDFQSHPLKYRDFSGRNDSDIIASLAEFGISISPSPASCPSALPTSVELWGTGSPKREFLHADDLADAAVFLMEHRDYRDIGEFINIGAGEDVQIKDLATIVKKEIGFGGVITWDKTKPDGTPRKLLDISGMKSLGWSPKVTLEEGIKTTYQWYCGISP